MCLPSRTRYLPTDSCVRNPFICSGKRTHIAHTFFSCKPNILMNYVIRPHMVLFICFAVAIAVSFSLVRLESHVWHRNRKINKKERQSGQVSHLPSVHRSTYVKHWRDETMRKRTHTHTREIVAAAERESNRALVDRRLNQFGFDRNSYRHKSSCDLSLTHLLSLFIRVRLLHNKNPFFCCWLISVCRQLACTAVQLHCSDAIRAAWRNRTKMDSDELYVSAWINIFAGNFWEYFLLRRFAVIVCAKACVCMCYCCCCHSPVAS